MKNFVRFLIILVTLVTMATLITSALAEDRFILGEYIPEWDGYMFQIFPLRGIGATLFLGEEEPIIFLWNDVTHEEECFIYPEEIKHVNGNVFLDEEFLQNKAIEEFGEDTTSLPDDGVDWIKVDFFTLEKAISAELGFTPIFQYQSNPSGYGTWEIVLPEENIQKVTYFTYDPQVPGSGTHWMSGEDAITLLCGQLDEYKAPLKDKMLKLYPTKDVGGYVVDYQYEDVVVIYDASMTHHFIVLNTEATEFIRELKVFLIMPDGTALVDGNEVAQAVYDAWATRAIR